MRAVSLQVMRHNETQGITLGQFKCRSPTANGALVRQTWGVTSMSQSAMRAMGRWAPRVSPQRSWRHSEKYRQASRLDRRKQFAEASLVANRHHRCKTVHRHHSSPDDIALPSMAFIERSCTSKRWIPRATREPVVIASPLCRSGGFTGDPAAIHSPFLKGSH